MPNGSVGSGTSRPLGAAPRRCRPPPAWSTTASAAGRCWTLSPSAAISSALRHDRGVEPGGAQGLAEGARLAVDVARRRRRRRRRWPGTTIVPDGVSTGAPGRRLGRGAALELGVGRDGLVGAGQCAPAPGRRRRATRRPRPVDGRVDSVRTLMAAADAGAGQAGDRRAAASEVVEVDVGHADHDDPVGAVGEQRLAASAPTGRRPDEQRRARRRTATDDGADADPAGS